MSKDDLVGALLRLAPAAWLLLHARHGLNDAAAPVLVAAEGLSGTCLLVGVYTRAWAAMAAFGIAPLMLLGQGVDAALPVILLARVALVGGGGLSVDRVLERRRSRQC